jgi:hypothetical protein
VTLVGRALGLAPWLFAVMTAFGCQAIVGIEDKKLEECGEQCARCEDYCELAMANCTGDHAVYREPKHCVALCNELPLGEFGEPANENTVACRHEQARLAGESEPELHCNGAGPAGGNLCGSDCESYCYLYETLCDFPFASTDECEDKCRALKDEPVFDVNGYYDTDTVECRIIHLANVASLGPSHCGHGAFQSTDHCGPPATEDPSCPDMCRVAMVACEGDPAVYDDTETCIATCEALPPGLNTDTHENSVGCRHYHSYNSILGPVIHCSHAGPGGAGHCGEIIDGAGNCESYCILAEAGCPTAYASTFADDDACLEACAMLPGAADDGMTTELNETEQYSVALAESRDPAFVYQCRLLHTTRAIREGGEPAAECDAVFGVAGSACN